MRREESQALAEELRSANEDLALSRDELHRANDSLKLVNSQLHEKVLALQLSNDDLSNLLTSSNVATVFLDRDLCVRRFTAAAGKLVGLTDEDIASPMSELTRLPELCSLFSDASSVWETLQPIEREVSNGSGRYYVCRLGPYCAQENRVEGVVITFQDISKRKDAERALQALNDRLEARVAERTAQLSRQVDSLAEQQRLLSTTLRTLTEGVVVVDHDGRVLMENEAAIRIVGHAAREVGGRSWCEAVGACAADGVTPLSGDATPIARALKGEEVQATEIVIRGIERDRSVFVEVRANPLRGSAGEIIGAVLDFSDLSPRKRAAETEARLATLVRSTRAAVLSWKSDGTIVDWNTGATRIFGYAEEEIKGQRITVLAVPSERREFGRVRDATQKLDDRDVEMRRKDGSFIHIAWTVAPVRDSAGRVVGGAAIGTDVSEQARLERDVAILADEQRKQLGHDLHDSLGQQLTAIGLLASSLKTRAEAGRSVTEVVDKIDSGIDTAKGQLRAIAKGLAPVEVDARGLFIALNELAEATERTHGVECRLECSHPISPEDSFSANQLYLIAREALHNAVKHARSKLIVIRLEAAAHGMRMVVLDDGIGIHLADDNRIELGMGLRIMRYRCRIIGGKLTIERGPTGGTVLTCTCGRGSMV